MKAIISNERLVGFQEPDSDGWYWGKEARGDIRYSCCGHNLANTRTFMAEGDGDKCPACGAEIEYTRQGLSIQDLLTIGEVLFFVDTRPNLREQLLDYLDLADAEWVRICAPFPQFQETEEPE